MVRISGCGGRMPLTQHIAVILTPWATWQSAGLRAYVHHSRRKSTLTVPYFWVRFNMHDNIIYYLSDVAIYARYL
jgi:hypothetical protein